MKPDTRAQRSMDRLLEKGLVYRDELGVPWLVVMNTRRMRHHDFDGSDHCKVCGIEVGQAVGTVCDNERSRP